MINSRQISKLPNISLGKHCKLGLSQYMSFGGHLNFIYTRGQRIIENNTLEKSTWEMFKVTTQQHMFITVNIQNTLLYSTSCNNTAQIKKSEFQVA